MAGTSFDPNTGVVTGKIDLSKQSKAAVLPEANKPLENKTSETAQDFSKLVMPKINGAVDLAVGGTKETIKSVSETLAQSKKDAAGQWDKLKNSVADTVGNVVHAVTHPTETLSEYTGQARPGEGTTPFSLDGAADNIRAHNRKNSQQ